MSIVRIPLERIEPNPFQTRQALGDVGELATSLLQMRQARPEASGLLQVPPARLVLDGHIVDVPFYGGVLAALDDEPEARVQLAAGHRRWQAFEVNAATDEEYTTFPVDVIPLTDEQMADIAWEENSKRKDISPIEEAEAIKRAIARFGWAQTEVARRWNLSTSAISNKLRLLQLPADVQELIRSGQISERHGRALLPLGELDASGEHYLDIINPVVAKGEIVEYPPVARVEGLVRVYITARTASLDEAPWDDAWMVNPSATNSYADVARPCSLCADQISTLGRRCKNRTCYDLKHVAYRVTVKGPAEANGLYNRYPTSWKLLDANGWTQCHACGRRAGEFKDSKYDNTPWYQAFGYSICPECWVKARLPQIAVATADAEEIASASIPAPAATPTPAIPIPAPAGVARPTASVPPPQAARPTPSAWEDERDEDGDESPEPAEDDDLPVERAHPLGPVPAPAPATLLPPPTQAAAAFARAKLITVRVQPGEILDQRKVTVSIGDEGRGPTAIRSGSYAEMFSMLADLCDVHIAHNGHNKEG